MPASDQVALVATAAAVTADAEAVAAVEVAAAVVADLEPVYRASVMYGFPFVDHGDCQSHQ